MIVGLIYLVVYIVILGLILWALNYLIDAVPLQEPFYRVAKVALMVVGILAIILLLLNFIGVIDAGNPKVEVKRNALLPLSGRLKSANHPPEIRPLS